jgi:hypothetical protein
MSNPVTIPYTSTQPDATGADTNHPQPGDFMNVGSADDLGGFVRLQESNLRAEGLNKQWERWLGVNSPYSPSPAAPTFIDGTHFLLTNDWTATTANYPPIAVVGRRVKAFVTAGTIFGTITAVAVAGNTTVTVAWDSGSLDSGLSEVQFGIPIPGSGNSSQPALIPSQMPATVLQQTNTPLSVVITNGGSGPAFTGALSPAITGYVTGQHYILKWTQASQGNDTVNLNGLGAIPVVWNVSTALVAGDVSAGAETEVVYDGTNFQLQGGNSGISLIAGGFLLRAAGNANSKQINNLANPAAAGDALSLGLFLGTLASKGSIKIPVWTGSAFQFLIINWGPLSSKTVGSGSSAQEVQSFQTAFTTACYGVLCTVIANNSGTDNGSAGGEASVLTGSISTSGFTSQLGYGAGGGTITISGFYVAWGR